MTNKTLKSSKEIIERYEKKFKEIVSEEVKKLEEKQQGLLNKAKGVMGGIGKAFSRNKSNEEAPKERILSDEEAPKQKILSPEEIRERAQKNAKNELDNDAKLTASHDQYERMKKSGLINPKDLETRIQADSLEELNQKLYQFVGKEGKFMPYTKAVQISLNNPNLKSLEIIDTPGVNDPIVSREARTKALLKECDVVFVIIPSGNFLTDSDMDLFDRVSNKEGIQRVYFVASQADSTVCAPSEVENSRHHLPTALENAQKSLSSSLNETMSLLEKKYPHQQEIFESAIKNGIILTSGVCYNLYKDFENQASWEREKEEYQLAWENLTNDYPDAFSSHETRENLKRLSNIDAIRERLEEAAKEKENTISQRLQKYLEAQANNLSSLVANLLRELESEKNRIKDADLNKISEQLKEYEKFSDKIETNFKEEYDTFVLNFIKDIKNRLNNALKEAAQTASDGIKEKEENPERVEQDGFWGGFKRLWGGVFGEDWGYESGIKAGAVIDFLKEMNKDCEDALNDQVKSFKIDFKKELYAKVLPVLREIINDDSLIDEVAFKKSVHAVTDKIEFKEFDHTDIPGEIEGQTGFLKGDEVKQFIESVKSYVRGFEDKTQTDVKNYCTYLEEKLGEQDFANGVLSKLKKDTQNLQNQVQNKAQSIAQLDVQIKALKEI